MRIICDQCGEEVQPLANYCSYCGSEAPRKTVMMTEEVKIENPIYCPSCGKSSFSDSLYCAWCGEFLFEKPDKDIIFCPVCNSRNRAEAKICSTCENKLTDWFGMKGIVAEKLGIRNNLILHETMNDIYYHFINGRSLSIGASSSSDIKISCPWVSSKHATVDFFSNSLIDNNSTNGTYVNRTPERINKLSFEVIKEFNIAGSFTFTINKFNNAFSLRLTAILDEDECRKVGNPQEMNELRKHYYIMVFGDTKIYVRRVDGYIEAREIKLEPMQVVEIIDGFFYFSNTKGNGRNRLITKKYSSLPINWKIIREGT